MCFVAYDWLSEKRVEALFRVHAVFRKLLESGMCACIHTWESALVCQYVHYAFHLRGI
uniref:Uncharacterized protein n=1 Tax=Anguilla anguilla TaxID=7936 RepID=A0A0E9SAV4_ANGAN